MKEGIIMKKITLIGIALIICIMIAGCSDQFNIVGMWKDVDGTVRTFDSTGACQNIAKIDIGGPTPTYSISEKPNSDGYYLLEVQQGGYNQTVFYVKVLSNDSIQIFENTSQASPL